MSEPVSEALGPDSVVGRVQCDGGHTIHNPGGRNECENYKGVNVTVHDLLPEIQARLLASGKAEERWDALNRYLYKVRSEVPSTGAAHVYLSMALHKMKELESAQ
jgi:hypothetical protein